MAPLLNSPPEVWHGFGMGWAAASVSTAYSRLVSRGGRGETPQPGHRERGWPTGPALPQRCPDQPLQFEFTAAPPALPQVGPDPGFQGRVEFPVQVGSETGAQQQVTHGMHAMETRRGLG